MFFILNEKKKLTKKKTSITPICLVQGDSPANAFFVKIDANSLVHNLKKIIENEKKPEFDSFAADKLELWKVNIHDNSNRSFV